MPDDSPPERPWTLLALPPLDRDLLATMFADLPVTVVVPEARTQQAAQDCAAEAELVIGDFGGAIRIDAELVAAAPLLAGVQQPSVGVDSLDLDALTARGIPVANLGDSNAVSVAEWCLGATFDVLRSLSYADRMIRDGGWPQLELSRRGGGELAGRRVGLVGMGRIGRETAQRFVALGADVAHWSRTRRPAEQAGGAPWLELNELIGRSDVLVVLVALTPQTRGLLDAAKLALLPQGAFVISAARGGIVDDDAMLAAIRSGAMAGAAMDVYATEPLPSDSPLRREDRIMLSPHAAGASVQSVARLVDYTIANIGRAVRGEAMRFVVNDVDPVVRRTG